MTTTEWITNIAGIGTFISAIVAAITIWEIKKQRQSAYIPDIFLDSYTSFLSQIPFKGENNFFRYKRHPYNEWVKKTEEEPEQFRLLYKLQNIGFGVAKNVNCSWEFDTLRAFNLLKGVIPEGFEIKTDKEKITIKNDSIDFWDFIYFSEIDPQKVDFILPVSIQQNLKDGTIPKIVTSIYSYYLIFKRKLHENAPDNYYHEDFEKFPPLFLHVDYLDIRGKKYKKTFSISFAITSTSASEKLIFNEKNELGIYYITVKEKHNS